MRILRGQNSFSKSFTKQISSVFTKKEYLRSSAKRGWTVWSQSRWEGISFKKGYRERRLRKQCDTEEYELTRSELFGKYFKDETSVWNDIARNLQNIELRHEINQISKISELASLLDPVAPGRIYKDHPWRGWWFWRIYSSMSRIHSSSTRPRIQSLCKNSWRNIDGTSRWCSHRTTSCPSCNWIRNYVCK